MEDVNNNVITPDKSVIQQPQTPPVEQTPKLNNIYKYLFLITLIILFGGIIYFYFILSNIKSELSLLKKESNISNIIPTDIPVQTIQQINQDTNQTKDLTVTIQPSEILKISDIQIELPNNWKVASISPKTAKILTDYPKYKVYLNLTLEKNNSLALSAYESAGPKIKTQYGEVYNVESGGVLGWTGALINNDKYSFVWDIESNQPIPEDLSGVWVPENNTTPKTFLEITKSVKPIKK